MEFYESMQQMVENEAAKEADAAFTEAVYEAETILRPFFQYDCGEDVANATKVLETLFTPTTRCFARLAITMPSHAPDCFIRAAKAKANHDFVMAVRKLQKQEDKL